MQDTGLNFSPDIPEDMRSFVMEGFEGCALAYSDLIIPIDPKPLSGDDFYVEPDPLHFYSKLQESDK